MRAIVIGSRGSALALHQARLVQGRLAQLAPGRRIELAVIQAHADKHPEQPLATIGEGEGVFVKELQGALLGRAIDLAVHSMKDLPLQEEPRLRTAAVLERDEPRDCVVSRTGAKYEQLPPGARIGTSSLRRRSQLLRWRGDLQMLETRGNVDTRLRKLDEERYDAIVIAACGLIRLGLGSRITQYLELQRMVPEPGQGAIAVEARSDDAEALRLVGALDHAQTRAAVGAERAFLDALGGGCRVPIAGYAAVEAGELALQGVVVTPDGTAEVRGAMRGPLTDPAGLGHRLAQRLTSQGALELLKTKEARSD